MPLAVMPTKVGIHVFADSNDCSTPAICQWQLSKTEGLTTEAQRHRDTKKSQEMTSALNLSVGVLCLRFSVPLCLCGESYLLVPVRARARLIKQSPLAHRGEQLSNWG
jgi:hypothetical protein